MRRRDVSALKACLRSVGPGSARHHRTRLRARPGSAHCSHPDLVRHSAPVPPYVLTHMQPPGSLWRRTHTAHVSERQSRGKHFWAPQRQGLRKRQLQVVEIHCLRPHPGSGAQEPYHGSHRGTSARGPPCPLPAAAPWRVSTGLASAGRSPPRHVWEVRKLGSEREDVFGQKVGGTRGDPLRVFRPCILAVVNHCG